MEVGAEECVFVAVAVEGFVEPYALCHGSPDEEGGGEERPIGFFGSCFGSFDFVADAVAESEWVGYGFFATAIVDSPDDDIGFGGGGDVEFEEVVFDGEDVGVEEEEDVALCFVHESVACARYAAVVG